MAEVTFMADHTGDGTRIAPDDMLREAAREWEGEVDKALAIGLVSVDGQYQVYWRQSGCRVSELVALLEVTKRLLLEDMGY